MGSKPEDRAYRTAACPDVLRVVGSGHPASSGRAYGMSYLPDVVVQALPGLVVAIVAAVLAWLLGHRYSARRAMLAAAQARGLAAAEELYRAYGQFFAVWKAWAFHTDATSGSPRGPVTPERRSELVAQAGEVESLYEAFLVRVTSERRLNGDELAALWALRFAFKQLRYAITQDLPLEWWREGHLHTRPEGAREYDAMKCLMVVVSRFTAARKRGRQAPSSAQAQEQLATVTGAGEDLLARAEFETRLAQPSAREVPSARRGRSGWQWVVVAEHVCSVF
ncbi:hypothetical protein [Georgenia wangjunii]|uniref:hypothetical protein n=1 Tax=Georgenia wangjunii TaxID=3117730 RepID=UPI002F26718A